MNEADDTKVIGKGSHEKLNSWSHFSNIIASSTCSRFRKPGFGDGTFDKISSARAEYFSSRIFDQCAATRWMFYQSSCRERRLNFNFKFCTQRPQGSVVKLSTLCKTITILEYQNRFHRLTRCCFNFVYEDIPREYYPG